MRDLPSRRLSLCAVLVPVFVTGVFAQSSGLPPEWEVRKDLAALVEQVGKLKPLLDAVKPDEWAQKGAPDTYKTQWKSVTSELDYLIRSTGELSRVPERLTIALEVYFRMQAVESMLSSLEEGVRKYQNPALADLLRGTMTEEAVHRERLRQYIVQLAATKEQELKVMNEEAQRCRTQISRQPPAKNAPQNSGEPK